jgi:DNA-binding NarL/FixJ family response regulator
MAPAIEAICTDSPQRTEYAREAWVSAVETGNYDLLITAYRGHDSLLESLRRIADVDVLGQVMARAHDHGLAQRWKIPIQRRPYASPVLTPRESEVINLVAAGSSNRDVAETLFISEATVKVHLRHIYERLDVRNRTEAVAKWLARPVE